MDGSGYASFSAYECIAGIPVDRHDGCGSEKASEFNAVTHSFADNWNDTYRGSLCIDHTYSHLICDDSGDRGCFGITGHCYHIKSHGAETGMNAPLSPPT